jgi:hypothetical protein
MTERKHVSPEALDASLLLRQRKPCLAIYVKDKIVLILRDKPNQTSDACTGIVWKSHQARMRVEWADSADLIPAKSATKVCSFEQTGLERSGEVS